MDNTLFSDDTDQVIDPDKNYLEEYVGEGKKFSDSIALARGKAESDLFIKKLQAESAQNRAELERVQAELETRTSVQGFVDQLKAERTQAPNNERTLAPNREDPTKVISPAVDIASEIEKALAAKTASDSAKTNLNYVADVLEQNFGPGWQQLAASKAKELGVGQAYLDDLAKRSPKSVFKLLDVSETPTRASNPAEAARANPGGNRNAKKNFAYFEKLRHENFEAYNSPAVRNEMLGLLKEQGDDFYR